MLSLPARRFERKSPLSEPTSTCHEKTNTAGVEVIDLAGAGNGDECTTGSKTNRYTTDASVNVTVAQHPSTFSRVSEKRKASHELPTELWRSILRLATIESSCIFPTTGQDTQISARSFGWSFRPVFDGVYFDSLATKHNLCLVSRWLRPIAEEFLYETIHLRRPEQALQLVGQFAAFCDPFDVSPQQSNTPVQFDFNAVLQKLEKSDVKLDLTLGLGELNINSESSPLSKPSLRLSKLQCLLQKFTRALIIAPHFPRFSREEDADYIDACLGAMHSLARACTTVTDVYLTADHTSLFHGPTYQPWVRLLAALPQDKLHNLSVQDFLLGPVVWSPRLFQVPGAGLQLRTLHIDAEHPPMPQSFPHLTHLHLFSWPTASAWDMPNLTHLYIQYLPDVTLTRSFWSYPPWHPRPGVSIHSHHTTHMRPLSHTRAHTDTFAISTILSSSSSSPMTLSEEYGPRREKLQLLHFGFDTDLGLYFPDLPARLAWLAPNLRTLEYHVAGDLPVRFDPRSLPRSLTSIKIQSLLLGAGMELPRWSEQECMTGYTRETLGAMEEYWRDRLTPEALRRWSQVCNHLKAYGDDQVKPVVLFPNDGRKSNPLTRFL